MSLQVTSSKRKLHRVVHLSLATLATLALFITAFPSYAATPQPQSTNPPQAPNASCPPDGQCFADVPSSNVFYAFVNRIYQQDLVTGYPCGGAGEPCDPAGRPYYRPNNNVTRQQMAKFIDNARHFPGIDIQVSSSTSLIIAHNDTDPAIRGISNSGTGVVGNSTSGFGVYATSDSNPAVYGNSGSGNGVQGNSAAGNGVRGYSGSGVGVYGDSGTSWAGYFSGNVNVTGTCCGAGAGTYKIDDPLDPSDKYLYHSAVQSPDMMNVYNGNVTTDDKGEAVVTLPAYFEALNRDYRYQLTVIGQFAQAIVSNEIKDNSFTVKTDKPNIKVSWQVTGIRQDPYANAHRIPVEEDKPADEKGKYLHPTELGQPASLGVDYEREEKMRDAGQPKP